MPKLIEPRPLNEVELLRRDQLNTHVRGYLVVLRQVVDLSAAEPGDTVRIDLEDRGPVNVDSIRRAIYRMAESSGLVLRAETIGEQSLLFHVREKFEPKVRQVRAPTRPWDRVLSIPQLALVKARRLEPDGIEHYWRPKKVRDVTRIGGYREINVYPWAKMKDGDFFWVKLEKDTLREKHRYDVTFSRAAARYDIEIQVSRILRNYSGEEQPYLRVTRVQGELAKWKRDLAEATGKRVPVSTGGKKPQGYSRSEARTIRSLTNLGIPKEEAVATIMKARENRRLKADMKPKSEGEALVENVGAIRSGPTYLGIEALRRAAGLEKAPPENQLGDADLPSAAACGTDGGEERANTAPVGEHSDGHRPAEGDGNLHDGGTDRAGDRGSADTSFRSLLAKRAGGNEDEEETSVVDTPEALRAAFAARRAAAARDLEEDDDA